MKKNKPFKLIALLLAITIMFTTLPVVALAQQQNIESEKPAHIVGEIESMRTENEKHFLLSDGKIQAAIYNSPVHFENDEGEWEEIDTTLKSQDSEEYATKNTKENITLSKKYKKGKTVEIASDNYNVSWGFVGANNSAAQIEEQETQNLKGDAKYTTLENVVSKTLYKNIYDNVDVEYIINGANIKENLILNNKTTANEFEIEYRYKKLTAVQTDDKTIELKNSKDKTVYTITAPIMTDKNGAVSDALTLKISKQNGNKLTVILTADKDWLQDNNREYPVVVDPTVDYAGDNAAIQLDPLTNSSEGGTYKSAIVAKLHKNFGFGAASYITNATLSLNSMNSLSAELPIYYMGDNATANYDWSDVEYKINNNYATDIAILDNEPVATWNLTKNLQQNYIYNNKSCFAIVSETSNIYEEMALYTYEDTTNFFLLPTLCVTYITQAGINTKYSYHEYDMGNAGTVYINDLVDSIAVKRTDFSQETSLGSIDIGMTYTTDFNYNIGSTGDYYWKPSYFESVSYFPDNSTYKFVWNNDVGDVIYFTDTVTDEEGNTYYCDEHGYDYKLYNQTDSNQYKIVIPDGKAYVFAQDGRNAATQNEKYLTKILLETESNAAINIEFNDALRISKLTDEEGNEYIYSYDENNANLLTSVYSTDNTASYTYNTNGNLTEVSVDGTVSQYTYYDNPISDYSLKAVIQPENYKLVINENNARTVTEYGFDDINWIQGARIMITRYPFRTDYSEMDGDSVKYEERYYFDKNGHLSSVSNEKGYSINQNADEKGTITSNTEVTIPVVNLIDNSSFETQSDSWTLSGNASVKTKTDTENFAYFGKKWTEINNTSVSTSTISKTIENLSKGTYTFSAYVRTATDGTIALGEDDTIYDGLSIRATANSVTKKATGIEGDYSDWTRIYVTFEVSENDSSATLQLGLYNASGKVYVDAVQLEKHKTAYEYNSVKNADFTDSSSDAWTTSSNVTYSTNSTSRGSLDTCVLQLEGTENQTIYAEQTLDITSSQKDLSVSAWISTTGMLPSATGKISVLGVTTSSITTLCEKSIDFCLDSDGIGNSQFYKVITPIGEISAEYDSYKLRIEYNCQQGFMYVDGVEVMSGALTVQSEEEETEDTTETEQSEEDYEIEDGYSIVSTINNFDTYTGNADCDYLVNGTVVNTVDESGNTIKDETASTAYFGNSWGVTKNKDKYEYTNSTGATKTTGGIWIGGKLDKTTQSGIRFWYKSDASWTVQLRSATYGKGGTYDYIKTLSAAPTGTWVTLLYKDIETTKRKISDFKYLFVKASTTPVYVDEVQTVLQDSIVYEDVEYNIADITQEENGGYPVIDEYVYDETIDNFNNYTGEFGYLANGTATANTAYSGNSWGVTKNVDKYEYTDENTNETHLSYGIVVGSFDSSKDGIRFWYKSSKESEISLRHQYYGVSETDYKKTLPAAPNGDWCTILYDDIENANKDLDTYYCIFIKTKNAPSVYIDELHYVVLADEYYSVSESYETSRDNKTMKTVSASKSLTLNGILCTMEKETSSLGIDTFTTIDDETGNQISATDGNGNTINYSYDDLNNLVKMSQEVGSSTLEVDYTYNDKGEIETITNGNVTYTYDYTAFGDLASISVGNTALVTYSYKSNQDRVPTRVTYANGQYVGYSYDSNGFLTTQYSDTNEYYYTLDELGNTISTEDNENNTVTLSYLDETQVWNSARTKLLYSYSSTDESFSECVNGTVFTTNHSLKDNTLDKTDLYTPEIISFGNITKTVYSDALERVVKEETKNGNTVVLLKEYEYTDNGNYTTDQIETVTTTIGSGSPETTRYSYDNNGNITGICSKVGNGEETTVATYEYDELNQLVKENDKTYVYDNFGNVLSAGNNTYSYSAGEWKDQLTSFNGQSITYDESGNPTNYLGASLSWKNGRQLSSYSKGNLSVSYEYNQEGLRTRKSVTGGETTTNYSYKWADTNLTHQSWGDKYIHFYYDDVHSVIGFTYFDGTSSAEYTYIKNTQDDILGIVDESGNVVATYSYDAWGNILSASGDLANVNPIRYRGYYYDAEIDMYYLQSRYYDKNNGRFVNADNDEYIEELIDSDEPFINLFAYCSNEFVTASDYTGNDGNKYKARLIVFGTGEGDPDGAITKTNITKTKKNIKTVVGGKVKVKKCEDYSEFVDYWNAGFKKNELIVIMAHGGPGGLGFRPQTDEPRASDLENDLSNLKRGSNVILLSCNAGHWEFRTDNVAAAISDRTRGKVIASDGTVQILNSKNTKTLNFPSIANEAWSDEFIGKAPKTNKGWLVYASTDAYDRIFSTGIKKATISKLCKQFSNQKIYKTKKNLLWVYHDFMDLHGISGKDFYNGKTV